MRHSGPTLEKARSLQGFTGLGQSIIWNLGGVLNAFWKQVSVALLRLFNALDITNIQAYSVLLNNVPARVLEQVRAS